MKISTYWWGVEFHAENDGECEILKLLKSSSTIEEGDCYEEGAIELDDKPDREGVYLTLRVAR